MLATLRKEVLSKMLGDPVTIQRALRRLFLLLGGGFAGLLAGWMVWAQTPPALSSKWSPGAIPGSGGVAVSAYPIITGKPFTAEYNFSSVQENPPVPNGEKVTYESHSIVARDFPGRVATRTAESPQVPFRGGASFIPAGGSISDPTSGEMMTWDRVTSDIYGKVVIKSRMLPNMTQSRPHPLSAYEREGSQTRNRPHGETVQTEDLGKRTLQNILTRGCRVTNFFPAGVTHNDQSHTIVDEQWSSPELRITVLHVFRDPKRDRIEQLDNIVLGEPDASPFEPPPGYEVRDMDAERERRQRAQYTVQPGEPEAEVLAGAWEADDPFAGKPEQLGIALRISAERRVPIHLGKATGDGPQKFRTVDVRLYHRGAGEDKFERFSTGTDGTTWDGHRLRIESNSSGPRSIFQGNLVLDLTFNLEKGIWTGNYTHDAVTNPVQLTRPGALAKAASNRFLGAWSVSDTPPAAPGTSQCLYVFQGSDGKLIAWRDSKGAPMANPGVSRAMGTFEEDDGLEMTAQSSGDTLILQLASFWSGGIGQRDEKFAGKLTPDGTQINGTWGPDDQEARRGFPSQPDPGWSMPAPATTFTRMAGPSCWSQSPN